MKVIATAGHVDHGKSTLVRALTGMEPDRWAEERRRGMTIDLGFAWLALPTGEQVAFVDVPGHERFVPNMLAGLGPVPAVMFVVAADGGWMPQSAEHLAAADALRVRHGLLVVTRADLADPGPALRQAGAEISATSLWPVEAVAVSAVTGSGLPELRDALARLAGKLADTAADEPSAPVRLWLDRSFTIRGSGTVVTGTLPAGTVRSGQELLLTPSMRAVRVRSLQALGKPAGQVTGVARVAVNLRGVPPDVPSRGMALVVPGGWTLTSQADVRIDPGASGFPASLPASPLAHIGSARTPARVRLLDPGGTALLSPGGATPRSTPRLIGDAPLAPPRPGEPGTGQPAPRGLPPTGLGTTPGPSRLPGLGNPLLPPGAAPPAGRGTTSTVIFARLTFRDPLPLHVGDRLLLRDPGAAGGPGGPLILGATVLDVAPPALRRRGGGAAAARELAQWPAVPGAADLIRRHGFLRTGALTAMGVTGLPEPVTGDWAVDPARWDSLRAELPGTVAEFTARDPLAPGMPVEAARAALGLPSRDLVAALVSGASGPLPAGAHGAGNGGAVLIEGGYLRLAAAPAGELPPRVADGVRKILAGLAEDPFAAPDAQRLRQLGLNAKSLATAARAGLLLRVAAEVVLAPGADQAAAEILAGLPQPFTTSQARQALRTSRRVAIPLLEHLDRARLTERLPGDLRRVR